MVSHPPSGRKISRLTHRWIFLLLLALWLSTPCPAESASPAVDDSIVRLQLRWKHQFQFAGYYAAIAKGYYREAGLNVTLVEGGKERDTIEEVLDGNAEYGVTNTEVLLHRLNGKPLVAVAAIFQHSPLILMARKDTGITVPQDLSGKFVKMSRTSRDIELLAMLRGEGIGFNEFVLLEDLASYEDYFDPNIDALAAYITNQPFYLREKNAPYSIISPASYGIDFYGDCLFTTEKEVRNHPERVEAFRQASMRGWRYALDHQSEIIDLILQTYHSTKSREHLEYEAKEIEKLIMADLVEIGHMNPGRWQHIAEVFRQFELVPDNFSLDHFLFSPDQRKMPPWIFRTLLLLGSFAIVISLCSFVLFCFNRRLQREINTRKQAEMVLQQNERALQNYSKQIEQYSLSAAAILSIRDEKRLFAEMSNAIAELSDFQRVLILLFKEEPPYRELIGSVGLPEEILRKIEETPVPRGWYDDIFSLGIKLGQMSCYVPHTMKDIMHKATVSDGEGPVPEREDMWHPSDNLFVRMNDENGELIGVISVDTSKSGRRPTDEVVRPLELYANLISQIIVLKGEYAKRRQLEQKLRFSQKLEALGNLTGGIAHDFNNLLGIIIGNAELAQLDTPQSNPIQHNLSEIRIASNRARDIVQHLLMFNHRSDNQLHPVVVADMLRDSCQFLRSGIPPHIALNIQIETIDDFVRANPAQIYQVLLNLVTNAVQSMEANGGTLTLLAKVVTLRQPLKGATGDLPPGLYLRLQVNDTGHGIAPHLLEKIFDPYYTTREFGKGAGMGLSIVHGIVQSHHGAVTVQSTVGKGSTFTVYLPVMEHIQEETIETKTSSVGGTETILLVDDEEPLLEVGTQMLRRLGYTVIGKSDPLDALELFSKIPERLHLLVTDMTMPGMSGSELAAKVLEIRPDMPIFLCTGYSDRINKQEAARLGITRYFEKPLDPLKFSVEIRKVLGSRQQPLTG